MGGGQRHTGGAGGRQERKLRLTGSYFEKLD